MWRIVPPGVLRVALDHVCRCKAVVYGAVVCGLVIATVGVDGLRAYANDPSCNAKLGHGRAVYRACVQAAPADSVKLGVFGLGGDAAFLGVVCHVVGLLFVVDTVILI